MKHETGIDRIFREGIGQPDFSGKDAAWNKMEQALRADQRRRRRPFAWFLLVAVLLGSAGWWFLKPALADQSVASPGIIAETNLQPGSSQAATTTDNSAPLRVPAAKSPAKAAPDAGGSAVTAVSRKYKLAGQTRVSTWKPDQFSEEEVSLKTDTRLSLLTPLLHPLDLNTRPVNRMAVLASRMRHPVVIHPRKPAKTEQKQQKWSVELVAGSDIFRLNKQLGYYGGVRINRHLDQGTLLSAGINYSANTVNEQYRLSNKPAQQTEADAQLNHITMIRMPVYFQRQFSRSKWALMAGLVPSYIIDASVYNVPNSFTGDPTQYRRFTINDINRFNILFGAGVKYSPFKRISFELSGSYGFTGLVKDSYINQARVNDNFRNIQAGLIYRLR